MSYNKWRVKEVQTFQDPQQEPKLYSGTWSKVSYCSDTDRKWLEQFKDTFVRKTVRTNEFSNVS